MAIVGAVVLSGPLGWVLPTAVATIASTPGVVPLELNWLARADKADSMLVVDLCLLPVVVGVFVWLDEYGINRRRRLLERVPGVWDD